MACVLVGSSRCIVYCKLWLVFWLGAVGALCTASYGLCSGWEQSVNCVLQVMSCVLIGSSRCIVYCKLWLCYGWEHSVHCVLQDAL